MAERVLIRNEADTIYISRPGYGFIWLDRESAKEVHDRLGLTLTWEETDMRHERHPRH